MKELPMDYGRSLPRAIAAATAVLACSASMAMAASSHMSSSRAPVSSQDRRFAQDAAQGGTTEVALGKLAEVNGSSPGVKQFGTQMATDHSKGNQALEQAASKAGLTLDWTPSASQRAAIVRLGRLHGARFDRAYQAYMVRDHRVDIAGFQKEANRGRNPALRALAGNTLPTLRHHLQMAQNMTSKTGVFAHHTGGMMNHMGGSHPMPPAHQPAYPSPEKPKM